MLTILFWWIAIPIAIIYLILPICLLFIPDIKASHGLFGLKRIVFHTFLNPYKCIPIDLDITVDSARFTVNFKPFRVVLLLKNVYITAVIDRTPGHLPKATLPPSTLLPSILQLISCEVYSLNFDVKLTGPLPSTLLYTDEQSSYGTRCIGSARRVSVMFPHTDKIAIMLRSCEIGFSNDGEAGKSYGRAVSLLVTITPSLHYQPKIHLNKATASLTIEDILAFRYIALLYQFRQVDEELRNSFVEQHVDIYASNTVAHIWFGEDEPLSIFCPKVSPPGPPLTGFCVLDDIYVFLPQNQRYFDPDRLGNIQNAHNISDIIQALQEGTIEVTDISSQVLKREGDALPTVYLPSVLVYENVLEFSKSFESELPILMTCNRCSPFELTPRRKHRRAAVDIGDIKLWLPPGYKFGPFIGDAQTIGDAFKILKSRLRNSSFKTIREAIITFGKIDALFVASTFESSLARMSRLKTSFEPIIEHISDPLLLSSMWLRHAKREDHSDLDYELKIHIESGRVACADDPRTDECLADDILCLDTSGAEWYPNIVSAAAIRLDISSVQIDCPLIPLPTLAKANNIILNLTMIQATESLVTTSKTVTISGFSGNKKLNGQLLLCTPKLYYTVKSSIDTVSMQWSAHLHPFVTHLIAPLAGFTPPSSENPNAIKLSGNPIDFARWSLHGNAELFISQICAILHSPKQGYITTFRQTDYKETRFRETRLKTKYKDEPNCFHRQRHTIWGPFKLTTDPSRTDSLIIVGNDIKLVKNKPSTVELFTQAPMLLFRSRLAEGQGSDSAFQIEIPALRVSIGIDFESTKTSYHPTLFTREGILDAFERYKATGLSLNVELTCTNTPVPQARRINLANIPKCFIDLIRARHDLPQAFGRGFSIPAINVSLHDIVWLTQTLMSLAKFPTNLAPVDRRFIYPDRPAKPKYPSLFTAVKLDLDLPLGIDISIGLHRRDIQRMIVRISSLSLHTTITPKDCFISPARPNFSKKVCNLVGPKTLDLSVRNINVHVPSAVSSPIFSLFEVEFKLNQNEASCVLNKIDVNLYQNASNFLFAAKEAITNVPPLFGHNMPTAYPYSSGISDKFINLTNVKFYATEIRITIEPDTDRFTSIVIPSTIASYVDGVTIANLDGVSLFTPKVDVEGLAYRQDLGLHTPLLVVPLSIRHEKTDLKFRIEDIAIKLDWKGIRALLNAGGLVYETVKPLPTKRVSDKNKLIFAHFLETGTALNRITDKQLYDKLEQILSGLQLEYDELLEAESNVEAILPADFDTRKRDLAEKLALAYEYMSLVGGSPEKRITHRYDNKIDIRSITLQVYKDLELDADMSLWFKLTKLGLSASFLSSSIFYRLTIDDIVGKNMLYQPDQHFYSMLSKDYHKIEKLGMYTDHSQPFVKIRSFLDRTLLPLTNIHEITGSVIPVIIRLDWQSLNLLIRTFSGVDPDQPTVPASEEEVEVREEQAPIDGHPSILQVYPGLVRRAERMGCTVEALINSLEKRNEGVLIIQSMAIEPILIKLSWRGNKNSIQELSNLRDCKVTLDCLKMEGVHDKASKVARRIRTRIVTNILSHAAGKITQAKAKAIFHK